MTADLLSSYTGAAITALLSVIAISMFIQPNAPRLFAAIVFVSVSLVHEFFFSHLGGLEYYGSAALLDLAIIILLSGINPVTKMVIGLQLVCLISIFINAYGWYLWESHSHYVKYELMFVALYAWALVIFIKRNGEDVGGFTVASWRSCFRFNYVTRFISHYKGKETV